MSLNSRLVAIQGIGSTALAIAVLGFAIVDQPIENTGGGGGGGAGVSTPKQQLTPPLIAIPELPQLQAEVGRKDSAQVFLPESIDIPAIPAVPSEGEREKTEVNGSEAGIPPASVPLSPKSGEDTQLVTAHTAADNYAAAQAAHAIATAKARANDEALAMILILMEATA